MDLTASINQGCRFIIHRGEQLLIYPIHIYTKLQTLNAGKNFMKEIEILDEAGFRRKQKYIEYGRRERKGGGGGERERERGGGGKQMNKRR